MAPEAGSCSSGVGVVVLRLGAGGVVLHGLGAGGEVVAVEQLGAVLFDVIRAVDAPVGLDADRALRTARLGALELALLAARGRVGPEVAGLAAPRSAKARVGERRGRRQRAAQRPRSW
jgi:hypothetical protein